MPWVFYGAQSTAICHHHTNLHVPESKLSEFDISTPFPIPSIQAHNQAPHQRHRIPVKARPVRDTLYYKQTSAPENAGN